MSQHRNIVLFSGLFVLVVALLLLDLCCGVFMLRPSQVWHALLGADESVTAHIVSDLRLPKALVAIMAGAALSVSGLMMQTLFRNPLAGPYILGISSGASLGVALVTMCWSLLPLSAAALSGSSVLAAIVGSALVMLVVLALSRRVRSSVTLLIVGMMMGSVAGALVSMIQNFANPDALKLFIVWTLGSLSGVGWGQMPVLALVMLMGAILTLLLIKPLNGLMLGEDYARGLGIRVERVRVLIVLATALLAGGITAFCGPIAFVGVAVPHLARAIVRSASHQQTILASALVGAALLLLCDILSSLTVYPLPISTLTALFGAPVVIYVILRR